MQKLLTIYLKDYDDDTEESLAHGLVEEYLDDYLSDGWVVRQLTPVPGNESDSGINAVWIIVLLAKEGSSGRG